LMRVAIVDAWAPRPRTRSSRLALEPPTPSGSHPVTLPTGSTDACPNQACKQPDRRRFGKTIGIVAVAALAARLGRPRAGSLPPAVKNHGHLTGFTRSADQRRQPLVSTLGITIDDRDGPGPRRSQPRSSPGGRPPRNARSAPANRNAAIRQPGRAGCCPAPPREAKPSLRCPGAQMAERRLTSITSSARAKQQGRDGYAEAALPCAG